MSHLQTEIPKTVMLVNLRRIEREQVCAEDLLRLIDS